MNITHLCRRFFALLIAIAMSCAITGCSGGDGADSEGKSAAELTQGIAHEDGEESYPAMNEGNQGNDSMPSPSGELSWAVYWYLCGSDLESGDGLASGDLEEMMDVQLPDNVTVVVEAGGADYWENGLDPDMLTRCVYDADGFRVIEEIPSQNMGEADTLADFLSFCNETYPADRRAVVIWNHGGGSVAGVAFDELYGEDSLTLPELDEAFSSADFGGKYELVGFDACLMATIETAAIFSDYAHWLVASEELVPGCGWDYEGLLNALSGNPNITGGQLGVVICDTFYTGCADIDQGDDTTMSVVNLTKVPQLVSAYDAAGCEALLAMAMDAPKYMGSFGRAAHAAENYGGNNRSEGYTNMVDLGDLVRKLEGNELLELSVDNLLSALETAVHYKVNGPLRSRASGLSCYYSYDGDYDTFMEYTSITASPAFMYFYDYILTGCPNDALYDYVVNNAPDYSAGPVEPQVIERPEAASLEDYPVTITDDGYAVIDLGSEIAEQLVGVYFDLAYVDEESGIMVFLGLDNDLDADWDNGVFKDNFRGVWGAIDGELVYMELSDEAEGYQTYAVPVLLNGEEYTLSVSYIFSTEEYKILGARRGIDENGMSDKNIRPLLPGDVLEPLLYVIYDVESDEDAVPTALGRVEVTAETAFGEADLGDGTFLFMFEMVDVLNNSYLSEAVLIDIVDGEIFLS